MVLERQDGPTILVLAETTLVPVSTSSIISHYEKECGPIQVPDSLPLEAAYVFWWAAQQPKAAEPPTKKPL